METRTSQLSKVFLLLVIAVVSVVTLQLLLRLKSIHMEDKRTFTQSIADKNLSKGMIPTTQPRSKLKDKTEGTSHNHWIVLLTVNFGFFDMFQNWLWYFQRHNLNVPVIVIAEDDKIFHTLTSVYRDTLTIVRGHKTNTDRAANYGTASYKKLVNERPTHILRYLEIGNNVLYCDTDSIWLDDPFPYLVGDFDIWAQMDEAEFCTGFLAIQSNTRTLQFTHDWKLYLSQRSTIMDQEGFNAVNKSGMRIQKLDNALFPSGHLYFSKFSEARRSKTVVVHNNYIKGHDNKVQRFKKFGLWKI